MLGTTQRKKREKYSLRREWEILLRITNEAHSGNKENMINAILSHTQQVSIIVCKKKKNLLMDDDYDEDNSDSSI